jgi:hypothetical protein
MDLHIDLGQVIIIGLGSLITIIAWFTKNELTSFGSRLDKHQEILFSMNQTLSTVVGRVEIPDRLYKRADSDTLRIHSNANLHS